MNAEDLDEWEVLVACVSDGVLWDEDWKDAESHLDAAPEGGRAVKKLLGIDEDSYVAVPPDPTAEESYPAKAALRDPTWFSAPRKATS